MNIVKRLTVRHLSANKSRTVITVLGIIISVAMITATFVSIASFLDMLGRQARLLEGDAEVTFVDITPETARKLARDERIERVGIFAQDLNGAAAWQLDGTENERTGTGNLYIGSADHLQQIISCTYEGTLPANSGEIALEQEVIDKNQLSVAVGDTITLVLGNRYVETSRGKQQIVPSGFATDEFFEEVDRKSFMITAILHTNPATSDYGIICGLAENELPDRVSGMVTLKKADWNARRTIETIALDYGLKERVLNKDLLLSMLAVDSTSSVITSLMPMVGVILTVIVTASIMMIYNAFGISLSERVRYLGMLASVGATRRQKRSSIYAEGLMLGLVGIPLGIGSGFLGIAVTLQLIGNKIIASGMLRGFTADNFRMKAVMPLWALIGIVLVSGVTIFVSCYLPARKASRIMPIDALRQSNEIKLKAQKLRTPKLIRLIFGYEGEIAHKNLKRNGRKARVITVSIGISMVLFLCASYFTDILRLEAGINSNPYQVEVFGSYSDMDEIITAIRDMDDVSDVFVCSQVWTYYEQGDNPANEAIFNSDTMTAHHRNLFKDSMPVIIKLTDRTTFRCLCEKNGLNAADYYAEGAYSGILVNSLQLDRGSGAVFRDSVVGQTYYYSETDQPGIFIGALIDWDEDEPLLQTTAGGMVQIIMPIEKYYERHEIDNETIDLGVITEAHAAVTEAITALMQRGTLEITYCADIVANYQSMNATLFVFDVFVYGFICLIMLVTVTNIVNIITTGLSMRRKEFAMLRSVGLTPKGLRRMICLESLLYGIRAAVVAIPMSILINYGINRLNDSSIPYSVDWLLILWVTTAVFVLISLTMLVSVRHQRDQNIVETLKEDIS